MRTIPRPERCAMNAHPTGSLRQFVYVQPVTGDVLLWDSWLRHNVPMNMSEEERIGVSFHSGWA